MSDKFNSKEHITRLSNSSEWVKNDDGSLTIPVVVIAEEVLDYPEFGTEEYVSDDIYQPKFLDQINGLPFVLEHPMEHNEESGQMEPVDVTSENYKRYIKGALFNPEAQPDKKRTASMLRIYDKDVVNAIEAGDIKELSAKYKSVDVKENGEFDGKKYNVKQTKMVLNHLALTEAGRAGDRVKVLINKQNSKGDKMTTEEEIAAKKLAEEKAKENQDPEGTTSEVTIEALAEQVKSLTEIVQGLVDTKKPEGEVVNSEPDGESEEEKRNKEVLNMVKENSVSKTDIPALITETNQTINHAKELIGNDAILMFEKLNSLDGLRRYALVKSKRYDENSIKTLSSEGAMIALREAAISTVKINSMRKEQEDGGSFNDESDVSFFDDVKNERVA